MKKIKVIKKNINGKSDMILHHCKQLITFIIKINRLILVTIFSKKYNKMPNRHNDTSLTRNQKVKKIGSFIKKEIIIGKANGNYLFLDGNKHHLAFAQTKPSKTTAMPMMNLLMCEKSYIVSDIKLQLFSTTSKYRQSMGNKVFLWNSGSREEISHRYNPLNVIEDSRTTC